LAVVEVFGEINVCCWGIMKDCLLFSVCDCIGGNEGGGGGGGGSVD